MNIPGFSEDFVKNGKITQITELFSVGGFVYAFGKEFYHDFQVFSLNIEIETDDKFSIFESGSEYCSFMNVTIVGNLSVIGSGIGGILVHNINNMTVYIINTEIDVPI